jgi:DNA-directed RNA polymerase specialized sigma24 family protein
MLRFEAPLPMKADEDLQQEAWIALDRALATWEGLGDFTAYYGTVLANHMAALNRWFTTEGRGGEQPLSLDADAFRDGDGRRVELIETVPDRTMDTAKIVQIRETINELVAARGDIATQACIAYESRSLLA